LNDVLADQHQVRKVSLLLRVFCSSFLPLQLYSIMLAKALPPVEAGDCNPAFRGDGEGSDSF
jgi:hypothetical protein